MSSRRGIDPHGALDAWPIPMPRMLRPTNAGTNNVSWFVDTPAGSFFLRIYQNTTDTSRIRFEHALLTHLQSVGLSFAVPRPLRTRDSDTYTPLEADGRRALAALFPVIAGQHPQRGNVTQATVCGGALAELDIALAQVRMDPELSRQSVYGDLGRIHPLVSDPLGMMAQLPVPRDQQAQLRTVFDELLARIPDLYGRLPQQIIHADYGRSNALLIDERVSGVLDFEFASPDLRAMDFAVGLWSFGIAVWRTEHDWPVIDAYAAGYRRRGAMTHPELAMLPTLLRLREATSLVHWVGRFRQALTGEDDIARRTGDMLRVDRWLQAHGDELIRRVVQALL